MPVSEKTVAQVLFGQRLKLLAYIEAIVRDEHLAEDVFQDVCALAIKKRDTIDDEEHLFRWTRKAARFRASYAMRKQYSQPLMFDDDLLDQLEQRWDETGNEGSDTCDALRACIDRLSPYARTLIDLRYARGISGQPLARAVNRQVNTVYVALARIHRALSDCIRTRLAITATPRPQLGTGTSPVENTL